MEYFFHISVIFGIYAILCLSANLLTGLTNRISLSFAVFYGTGAYTTALCVLYLNWTVLPSLILIAILNSVLALIISIPSQRVKGDYFILATISFQVIIYSILNNWVSVTKGAQGITGIKNPVIFCDYKLSTTLDFFIFTAVLLLLAVFAFYKLIKSPYGRVLRGIRDNEIALLSLGRNTLFYNISAFVISAAFTGMAGYLYATYITYIDPGSFTLDESIFILTALLIGGTGNIKGPIAGALLIVLLPECLRFVGLPDNIAGPARQIIYASALILIMKYRKQGIAGVNKFS